MKIIVFVDEGITLNSLIKKKGNVSNWMDLFVIEELQKQGHEVKVVCFHLHYDDIFIQIRGFKPSIIFNLVLTINGKEQNYSWVAAFAELMNIPITGPSVKGLELSLDKSISKILVNNLGISTPKHRSFKNSKSITKHTLKGIVYPTLIKPKFSGGSSTITATSLVFNNEQLVSRLLDLFNKYDQEFICEEYIIGKDISIALLENNKLQALPPCEWQFSSETRYPFVTEKIKWEKKRQIKIGAINQRANLGNYQLKLLTSKAKEIFRVLELRDYAAIDFRMTPTGEIYFLEANSNPGLNPNSLRWNSLDFSYIIKSIVESAKKRK